MRLSPPPRPPLSPVCTPPAPPSLSLSSSAASAPQTWLAGSVRKKGGGAGEGEGPPPGRDCRSPTLPASPHPPTRTRPAGVRRAGSVALSLRSQVPREDRAVAIRGRLGSSRGPAAAPGGVLRWPPPGRLGPTPKPTFPTRCSLPASGEDVGREEERRPLCSQPQFHNHRGLRGPTILEKKEEPGRD